MRNKVVYLFVIPLILILFSIYTLNRFNKNKIKAQFEKLTIAEGDTILSLVEIAGFHLIEEGEEELKKFMKNLYKNELIVYIGLFKNNELIFLLTHFEGYFPIITDQKDFHVIDSPVGTIFDIKGFFVDKNKNSFILHIGFNYEFLSTFETAASRNFLIIAGILSVIVLVTLGLIAYFNNKFIQKVRELDKEKQEKERLKELSLLTSEIAHEIKNPLNSIYLSFNSLENFINLKEKKAIFYKDAIKGEIRRITEILHSYSDLSKEINPKIEIINLNKFFVEFQFFMEGELKNNNTTLMINNFKNIDFNCDSKLLKQILINMVKNSMEAGANSIELIITSKDRGLIIAVKDNGEGIKSKDTVSIFKPYFSSKTKGMGLGLHIVLKIISVLNGNIKLLSGEPENTIFKIEIPNARIG